MRQSLIQDHPGTQLGLSTDKITVLVTFTKELPQNILPNRKQVPGAVFKKHPFVILDTHGRHDPRYVMGSWIVVYFGDRHEVVPPI